MASSGLTPRGVRCNIVDDALALQFGDGMHTIVPMDVVTRSKTLHSSMTDTSVEDGWVLDAPGRFVRDWLECLSFLGLLPTSQNTLETIQSSKVYSYLKVRSLKSCKLVAFDAGLSRRQPGICTSRVLEMFCAHMYMKPSFHWKLSRAEVCYADLRRVAVRHNSSSSTCPTAQSQVPYAPRQNASGKSEIVIKRLYGMGALELYLQESVCTTFELRKHAHPLRTAGQRLSGGRGSG